ncbi:MAG TPA: TIGR02996 domain-containing protein [Bryobacteraceae bacterium]|jgi:uncharacterized protein (TIGR02996 family)
MNEELLRSVIADPDSDAPRLAYADWAASQPDEETREHSAFIRGQIAIARADPMAIRSGEFAWSRELLSRALANYGPAWSNGIGPLVSGYEFERGFVGLVRMSAQAFMENAGTVFNAAPIRHLDLLNVRDVDENLTRLRAFARVRSLAMDECGLYDFHVRLFIAARQIGSLRWLSLKNNHLTLAAAEAIAASEGFSSLQFADFRGNPVDPGEQLGYDAGEIVSAWLPPEGERLEERFGYLAWLHRHESNMDRFSA